MKILAAQTLILASKNFHNFQFPDELAIDILASWVPLYFNIIKSGEPSYF